MIMATNKPPPRPPAVENEEPPPAINDGDDPVAANLMTSPRMSYTVATDAQARTKRLVEVRGIPHAMLIDPKGIVRFEGMPHYLGANDLERLMAKYSN